MRLQSLFPRSPHRVEDYLPPSTKAAAHFVHYVVEGHAASARSVDVERIVTIHFMRRWIHTYYRYIVIGGKVDGRLVRRARHIQLHVYVRFERARHVVT